MSHYSSTSISITPAFSNTETHCYNNYTDVHPLPPYSLLLPYSCLTSFLKWFLKELRPFWVPVASVPAAFLLLSSLSASRCQATDHLPPQCQFTEITGRCSPLVSGFITTSFCRLFVFSRHQQKSLKNFYKVLVIFYTILLIF